MLLADEAEALTRKAVELALGGDPTALRLCVERILPRDRAVKFTMPRIASAADVAGAMGAVAAALAQGVITPGEAGQIAQVIVTSSEPSRPAISTSACNFSKPGKPLIRPASRSATATQLDGEISLLICCRCSGPVISGSRCDCSWVGAGCQRG